MNRHQYCHIHYDITKIHRISTLLILWLVFQCSPRLKVSLFVLVNLLAYLLFEVVGGRLDCSPTPITSDPHDNCLFAL
jgi:hypothetical protein